MRNYFLLAVLALFTTIELYGQMYIGNDTLYGNEWIDYEKTHLKFTVEEQGIYRINFSDIQNDFPQGIRGDELRLFNYGEEQHIYVSETGPLAPDDYILFYGVANNGRLDAYLYEDTSKIVNPYYSFYTDKNPYFLSIRKPTLNFIYSEKDQVDISNTNPESFLKTTSRKTFSDQYSKKEYAYGRNSLFDKSEGYGSVFNAQGTLNFDNIDPYLDDKEVKIIVHYRRLQTGNQSIVFSVNENEIGTKPVSHINTYKDTFIVFDYLLEQNNNLSYTATDAELAKISISFIELNYNSKPTIVNQDFIKFSAGSNDITSFNIACDPQASYMLFDLENQTFFNPSNDQGLLNIGFSPNSTRDIILFNEQSIKNIKEEEIKPIEFNDFSTNIGELLIVYNYLLEIEENGNNIIEEYANYHRFESPDNKSVTTAEIQEIVNQFAYGVLLHPMGIRNFGHYALKNSSAFKNLYLIGKPRRHYNHRSQEDFNTVYGTTFFLPTIGNYSSDNLFASNNEDFIPKFGIGRLAAIQAQDIRNYLDKVKEFETYRTSQQTIDNKLWTKKTLHLIGGNDNNEEENIFTEVFTATEVLKNNSFGANVDIVRRYFNETITTQSTDYIQESVDDGLAILSVFGHSTPFFTQFGLDDVGIFTNKGKYPMIISGGCYSGQCAQPTSAIGENMVLAKDKGGIFYMGVSGFGVIPSLGKFMKGLYSSLGGENYGTSVGEALQNTYNQIDATAIGDDILLQQLVFQGDPSLKFFYHERPDYTSDNEITVSPERLTTSLDYFEVKVPLYNIGKNISDEIVINISIKYSEEENREPLLSDTINTPAFLTELTYEIPVLDKDKIAGFSRLYIDIDVLDDVEEQENGGESNNAYKDSEGVEGYPLFFISNELKPVFPFNFNQKQNDPFKLYSTTSYSDLNTNTFFFELDTLITFDSPFKKSSTQSGNGGLVEWDVYSDLNTNQVYYWRTGINNLIDSNIDWNTSSFNISSTDPKGWHQSHYQQIAQDTFINLGQDLSSGKLVFRNDLVNLNIKNIVKQTDVYPVVTSDIGRYFYFFGSGTQEGVGFVVINPNNLECVQGLEGNGQEAIYAFPWGIGEGHIFKTSTATQREEVVNFINNIIPENAYVAFMTLQYGPGKDYKPEEWAADNQVYGTNIFEALENKGATLIRDLEETGSIPYGFIYQEGNPDFSSAEGISQNPLSYLNVTTPIEGNFNKGILKTQHIGPASAWGRLKYEFSDLEIQDSIRIDLYGIDTLNNNTLLKSYSDSSLDEDISQLVNADIYPEIYLNYFASDSINTSVPNLEYWTVEFESIPDACVAPNISFELQDTIYKGEMLNLRLAVKNISDYDMDSLLVKTSITDVNGGSDIFYKRYPVLKSQNIIYLQDDFQLDPPEGLLKLIVEINPNDDQPELSKTNNTFYTEVVVLDDRIDPLLSVRFDGKRIIDGDLVSPSPLISISIKDDNPDLLLNDTSYFDIKIKDVNNEVQTIYFDEAGLVFQPADDASNTATIEFQRDFEEDGIYTLYIAAKDVSGNSISSLSESPDNISAGMDYKIDFEVINKSMLSNFYNYPNPFSNATRFVYTLTGDKIPTYFKVQILTASGKLVREISQAEFGPLLPGTHQSEFVWDGRDQYGDQLANGVYLYKIIAKDENGDNFEKYDLNDSESLHFLNGFGKMVLVR